MGNNVAKRVLVIAHNCVLASSQERLVELSAYKDLKLWLLVPPSNLESHGVIKLEKTFDPNYEIVRGKPLFSMIMGQRYLQFYPLLCKLLRRIKPDVIDLHEEPWSMVSFQTILLRNMFLKNCRVVVETEQNIHKEFPYPFSKFEKYVLKHSDVVVARNEEARGVVLKKGFTGKTAILPNGLDKKIFFPMPNEEMRCEIGLRNFVVGYMGRIEKEKGLEDLVRAIAACGLKTEIDLLFVGEGSQQTALAALAEELGIAGRTVWHKPVPQAQAPLLLNCMDVLVLPSRTTPTWKEQFGRVLAEAMACGVPVIGSDSGAIPEVIADAGLVFPEGDVDALKRALERIITEKELRAGFIENGHKMVDTSFSWACVAERLHEIFIA